MPLQEHNSGRVFCSYSQTIFYKFRYCKLHIMLSHGKWFEPRSLSRLCGLIVRVRVVPRRTVVGDIDRRFDNLSGSHHQSHVNCVSSVYGIYVSGQFSRDSDDDFRSGCRNVGQCHQQQSFSGLLSPGRSNHTNEC